MSLRPDHIPAPMPTRNGPLLEKVAAQIEETPHRWWQHAWWSKWSTQTRRQVTDHSKAPECETRMCIAGWALALHDGEEPGPFGQIGIVDRAQRALGLTHEERSFLFYGGMDNKGPRGPRRAYEVAASLRRIAAGEDVVKAMPEWW